VSPLGQVLTGRGHSLTPTTRRALATDAAHRSTARWCRWRRACVVRACWWRRCLRRRRRLREGAHRCLHSSARGSCAISLAR
jgi:hypothetical protein